MARAKRVVRDLITDSTLDIYGARRGKRPPSSRRDRSTNSDLLRLK